MPGGKGAQSNSRPTKVEQQKTKQSNSDSSKDIYVSVTFSIVTPQQLACMMVQNKGTKWERNFIVGLGEELEKSGTLRDSFDYSIFVDCSRITPAVGDDKDQWRDDLIGKLNEAAIELKFYLAGKREKMTVHVSVVATVGVKELGYAMAYACGNDLTSSIKDDVLKQKVKAGYNKFYEKQLRGKGSSIKTDYYGIINVYQAVVILPEKATAEETQQEETEEYEEEIMTRERPKLVLLNDEARTY